MKCITLAVLMLVAVTACRDYDGYSPLAGEAGLVPAAQWASYGVEQAKAVAIGREFAEYPRPGCGIATSREDGIEDALPVVASSDHSHQRASQHRVAQPMRIDQRQITTIYKNKDE